MNPRDGCEYWIARCAGNDESHLPFRDPISSQVSMRRHGGL
jgi:hypothetical protein